ncbi:hypothetical protein VP01_2310g2 [Puccinia sorghi]|uniref:Uncharacterized protein n=1 Tax=Puccinia sorghi TaxID=27349 RepID=A0A0L6V9L0_9BASI|nr:hypothetical protein VP01_2310g2 [Puccinia sorghi]
MVIPQTNFSGFAPSQMSTRSTPPQSSWAGFSYCPAPRVGGTMVPNRNQFDSSYANQVIMIGGRTDSKNWNDQGGAAAGEVAILDISSGIWARVLPMRKDNATFTPKEGLLALALPTRVGATDSKSTDILVYGGIDVASGQASNELWILRLHPGKLTGNGTADGVTMTYMPSCVTPTPQNKNNKTNNPGSPSGPAVGDEGNSGTLQAPIGHLLFSALALAIMMASLTMLRCEEPGKLSIRSRWRTSRLWLLIGAWHTLILSCALLALAVVISLFQTHTIPASLSSSLAKRSLFTGDTVYPKLQPQETLSQSTHARLGLAIVIVGFIVVPILYLLSWLDDSIEARHKKNQLSSADAGPRKLKAKEAQGSRLTRRALERVVLLTRHPFGSPKEEQQQQQQHDMKPPSKETVTSRLDLGSVAEKHGEIVVERRLSVPSGDKRSPMSEGINSRTTSRTSTQSLTQRSSSSSAGSGPNGIHETTTTVARRPSPSKLKLDLKPAERPLVRSPFSKVFRHLPAGLFGRNASEPPPDGLSSAGGGGTPSPGFEVLNRRPPRQRPRPRASLDIMSDPGSPTRQSLDPPTAERPSETTYEDLTRGERYGSGESEVAEEEVVEEEEEEEDEDDSVYKRQTKARRKMRRLADVALHLVVLLANIYFISSCFMSQRELRWLGALAIGLNLCIYSTILWLAWAGKPSSESTLVIFLSILKDGSKNLMANDSLPGLGQFSSFQQQQQQAVQQQQQVVRRPSMQTGMGSGSVGGMGGKRSTRGSGFQALSLYGGSQPGAFYGGFYAAATEQGHQPVRAESPVPPPLSDSVPAPNQPSSLLLYDSHRLWASPPLHDSPLIADNPLLLDNDDPALLIQPRDSYLLDREIQIVTTAPKRKLAVVNH